MEEQTQTCTAFDGHNKIAAGSVFEVAGQVKRYQDKHPEASILIFDNATSAQVELDLRGTVEDVLKRIPKEDETENEKSGPGRPKLGVVSREIGLLPDIGNGSPCSLAALRWPSENWWKMPGGRTEPRTLSDNHRILLISSCRQWREICRILKRLRAHSSRKIRHSLRRSVQVGPRIFVSIS